MNTMMKSRLLSLRKNITKLLETRKKFPPWSMGARKYASRTPHCDAHMNELPIPCGPFEPYYNGCQSFYNKVLFFGAVWFAFSAIMMVYTGSFYLNWTHPAQPSPPTDMVTDADDRC